jgi:hypothetical protein
MFLLFLLFLFFYRRTPIFQSETNSNRIHDNQCNCIWCVYITNELSSMSMFRVQIQQTRSVMELAKIGIVFNN